MIKTYKRDETGTLVAYHEVWVEPENRRIIEHWGPLGEPGETRAHGVPLFGSLNKRIQKLLAPAYAAGYSELEDGDHSVICVEYLIEGMGTEDDLAKRHALEDRANEILGWTGLGHCDGGSIGSGAMEAACYVVDPALAITVLTETLTDEDEFKDFTRIYQE